MKRKIKQAVFTCLLMAVLIGTAQVVFAETKTSGDWKYETYKEYGNSGTTTVACLKRYHGSATSVKVPSSIDGYKVKKLDSTFMFEDWITSVTIPNGVTDLHSAFWECSKLKKVSLPSSIENYSYAFCASGLEEITLPKGKYTLSDAFLSCESLKKVTILGTVLDDGFGFCETFGGCTNLTSVYIAGVEKGTFARDTFSGCEKLQSVTLPNGIGGISGAFDKCTNLRTVHLPKSVYFSDSSFAYCYKLKDIYFGGSKSQWYSLMKNYPKTKGDKISQATVHCTGPNYTGLVKENGKWIYMEKGQPVAKTGLAKRTDGKGGWFYVEKGELCTNKSGITKRIDGKGGWYYVEKGVHKTKTGLTKRIDGKGGWFYVEKGVYKTNRIGLTKRVDGKNGWFYVRKGRLDTTKTGLVRRIDGKGGLFLVKKGVYQSKFTGTYKDSTTGRTYNIVKGVVK